MLRFRICALCASWLLVSASPAACGSSSSAVADGGLNPMDDGAVPDAAPSDANAACPADPALPQGDVEVPPPTGAYGVVRGVRRTMIDVTRDADGNAADAGAGGDAGAVRALAVEVWYPTERCPAGDPVPYLDQAEAIASGLTASDATRIHTHARAGLPFASGAGARPLLLFSHGYSTIVRLYSSFFEELVSHGYVVATLSHTYWNPLTTFADGTTAAGVHDQPQDALTLENAAPVWLADLRFVLDELTKANANDPAGEIAGHLDLTKVGTFGHSFGGSTALGALATDARVKAALGFDSAVFGAARNRAIAGPILLFLGDLPNPTASVAFNLSPGPAFECQLATSLHYNFSDVGLHPAYAAQVLDRLGTIDPVRALRAVNAYTLAFFDQALLGTASQLLAGPSADFTEITFQKRP